jgi:hypothetical protein
MLMDRCASPFTSPSACCSSPAGASPGPATPWPVAGLVIADPIGLRYSSASSFVLLAAIGIVTVPARPNRVATALLGAAAILQVVLGFVATTNSVDVKRFLHVLV